VQNKASGTASTKRHHIWYNPEVIPGESQLEFLDEDSALALELQPCWQTVLGQVTAYQEIDFDTSGLTHGDILHCLVISVYIKPKR